MIHLTLNTLNILNNNTATILSATRDKQQNNGFVIIQVTLREDIIYI